MVVLLVLSLRRDWHSAKSLRALCMLIRERGVASSFLTISAEQRHQIDGTVSEDHLHSTWWRVIPRYGSHTSNIVDWLRLWRAHRLKRGSGKLKKKRSGLVKTGRT